VVELHGYHFLFVVTVAEAGAGGITPCPNIAPLAIVVLPNPVVAVGGTGGAGAATTGGTGATGMPGCETVPPVTSLSLATIPRPVNPPTIANIAIALSQGAKCIENGG
jgi:hypothetical protein